MTQPALDRRGRPDPAAATAQDVIELVLAESYPLLLEGMVRTFAAELGFRVVASCTDGDEALRAVRQHRADVLVMDVDIAGDAMKILNELAKANLPSRTVLLAGTLDPRLMLEAMRLGVKGVVLKSMARHLLVQCVRKVHGGGTWIERGAMGRTVEKLLHDEAASTAAATLLSPREIEVVRLAVAGAPNKEIAKRLFIAEGTVKTHLHRVYERLGVRSRIELTLYAHTRDIGLLPPPFAAKSPQSGHLDSPDVTNRRRHE